MMLKNIMKVRVVSYRLTLACLIFSLSLISAVTLFPRVSDAYPPVIHEPQIDTSTLFREAKITFSGTVDEGCSVVVKVVGTGKKVVLGQNGLVASDYAMVDNLPGLYKILGSGNLSDIDQNIKNSLGITNDFSILKNMAAAYAWSEEKKVLLAGPESEKQIYKAIAINEHNGSYRLIENGIKIRDGKFEGTLFIGRNEYSPQVQVLVAVVRGNTIVSRENKTVSLQGSSFVKPFDIEREPLLFIGIFFCLTVITIIGADEILGRGEKAVYR